MRSSQSSYLPSRYCLCSSLTLSSCALFGSFGWSEVERTVIDGYLERSERFPDTSGVMRRVLVAGLSHQTNTFVGGRTGLEDFEIRRGEEILRNDVFPIAGVLEVGREKDWEILPVVDMRAMSGATVADAEVDLFWAEFRAVADSEATNGVDGVFVILHGAMVSESVNDVEG